MNHEKSMGWILCLLLLLIIIPFCECLEVLKIQITNKTEDLFIAEIRHNKTTLFYTCKWNSLIHYSGRTTIAFGWVFLCTMLCCRAPINLLNHNWSLPPCRVDFGYSKFISIYICVNIDRGDVPIMIKDQICINNINTKLMNKLNALLLNAKILSFTVYNLNYSIAFYIYDRIFFNSDATINFIARMSFNNIFFSKILQILPQSKSCILPNVYNQTPYFNFELNLDALDEIENSSNIVINRTPYFSGTTSVVYRGILNSTNQSMPVIIKIKKKGLSLTLKISYCMVKVLCYIIDKMKMLPSINLSEITSIIYENVTHQNDFINEINNLEHFRRKFSHNNMIIIPKPYRYFTDLRNDVIVMDYIECDDIEHLNRNQAHELCRLISNFNLNCILNYSMFHCDVHRGNIKFFRDENVIKLVVLDYGIVGYMSCSETNCIINLLKAASSSSISQIAICVASGYLQTNLNIDDPLSDEYIENEMQLCGEIEKYLENVDLNRLGINDYMYLSKVLINNGYQLKPCFARLYLSLIITHTFCADTLKVRQISDITKETVARLILQNQMKKFMSGNLG